MPEDKDHAGAVHRLFSNHKTDCVLFEFSPGLAEWNFLSECPEKTQELCALMKTATHCVIVNAEKFCTVPVVLYVLGNFTGREIPVFVSSSMPAVVPCIFESCRFFPDIDALISYVDSNFSEFISDEAKKKAKKKLFDTGIAFSADSFARLVIENNKKSCQLFFDGGFDVNSRDSSGTPMLNIAARCGNAEFVQWFLDLGADIDAVSEDRGYSAVMDAVWKNKKDIVELLVRHNARLDFISRDGQSVLVLASNNVDVAELLVKSGADPYVKDGMGMSAYDYAKLFGNKSLTEIFDGLKK